MLSNAATDAANVVGLVYVAAFAPDEGEVLGEVTAGSKDSVLNTALVPLHYPTGDGREPAVEFAIDPAKFRDAFAADLPAEQTAVMAATQRPVAEAAFAEQSGPPAWKRLPCWAAVASADTAAGTDVIHSMAERAGATITELEGSHVIMISQPQAVTDVILQGAVGGRFGNLTTGRDAAADRTSGVRISLGAFWRTLRALFQLPAAAQAAHPCEPRPPTSASSPNQLRDRCALRIGSDRPETTLRTASHWNRATC